jgi:hypothetical protein
VAEWQCQLADSQCDTDQALRAKVKQLVAGCGDNLSKIRALCRYVQNITYVAIDRKLGIGFGYRPRKATEVYSKNYGDCKDKVNALRAMLREAGVRSHAIAVNAEEGASILPKWPSPTQFNHAIIGIEVDDTVQLPTVLSQSPCGRLLLFDPTDTSTPLGGLPFPLQGTKGALQVANCDHLIDLPTLSPETDQLVVRSVQLQLGARGGVTGRCSITTRGQAGAHTRSWFRHATAQDLKDGANKALAETLVGFQVRNVAPKDDPDSDRCELNCEFSTETFAQPLPGSMQIVRLDVLSRGDIPIFSNKSRETPVLLHPIEQRDEVTLEMPAGWSAEEHPADVMIQTQYGKYTCTFEVQPGKAIFRRSFSLRARHVSVAEYVALRKFLSAVAKADQAALLLRHG